MLLQNVKQKLPERKGSRNFRRSVKLLYLTTPNQAATMSPLPHYFGHLVFNNSSKLGSRMRKYRFRRGVYQI